VNTAEAWEQLDEPWRVSFELAWEAFAAGSIPVGAVVVAENGSIISHGRNRVFDGAPPPSQLCRTRLAHAEINALAQLARDRRWNECTLFTTLEPCVLCVGAASMSKIGRILYAGSEPYSGSSSLATIDLPIARPLNLTIQGPLPGPFGDLGAALHLAFFAEQPHWSALLEAYASSGPALGKLAEGLLGLRRSTLGDALVALG
jgi:tRNA(adenine34) deaminase